MPLTAGNGVMIMLRRKGGPPKAAIWVSAALIVIVAALTIYFVSSRPAENDGTGGLPERDAKEKLSLRDLRELAGKGDALRFEDFGGFFGADVSSDLDYHIMIYGVEGGYRLIVRTDGEKIDEARLERIWDSGGSGVDIRSGDVDAFIRGNPSAEVMDSWRGITVGATQEDVHNIMGEPEFELSGLPGEGYQLIDGAGIVFYYDNMNEKTVSQIRRILGKDIVSVKVRRLGSGKTWTFADIELYSAIDALNQRKRTLEQVDLSDADYSVKIYFYDDTSEEYKLLSEDGQGVLTRDGAAWLLHPDAYTALLDMLV